MIQIKKTILTLVALFAISTGAWATTDPNTVVWYGDQETWAGWAENVTTHTVGDITITCSGNAKAYESTTSGEPLALQAGANDAITFTSNGKPFASIAIQVSYGELNVAGWTYNSSTWSYEWSGEPTTSVTLSGCDLLVDVITFTFGTASSGTEVAWDNDKKTGQFTMPGGNVELEPEYYPQAALTAVPTAINDVPATTDGAIVNAGTVANIDGTTTAQGTVMYYAMQSATAPTAPDYDATGWTDKVPTATDFAEGNVYVWYYVKGADGDETSTFSDGAITKLGESGYITLLAAPKYNAEFAFDEGTPDAEKAKWGTNIPDGGVVKGQTVTVTYTGTKKVLGVKAEKKAKAATLQTVNITGDTSATLYYLPGETFGQAIANHPENSSFEIKGGYITCNGLWLSIGYYDGDVTPDTLVEANGDYRGLLA